MKRFLISIPVFLFLSADAQVPEDAVRYSWNPQNLSARINSIGGTMGSLAGDISTLYVNPAGIAFFNTREVSFGLNWTNTQMRARYRDSSNLMLKNNLGMSPIGVIIGQGSNPDKSSNEKSSFAFAFNQLVSFNNQVRLRGYNNYSSFSEIFAEEFAKSGLSINEVLQSNSPLPFTAAPALYTYLIDTVRLSDGTYQIKAAPEYLLDAGQALAQDYLQTTKGGIYELTGGFATNFKDKYYVGMSVGIPIINYKSNTIVTEADTSSNTSNHFSSFRYEDDYQTIGTGINLRLGFIYRPKDYIRLGVALHTPNWMFMTDKRNTYLSTELEDPINSYSVSSRTFTNGSSGKARYIQTTPWKAVVSGSYVFREVENVNKQRGFITADIEYVNHRGTRFNSKNEDPTREEKNYYKSLNKVVKSMYKGAFNFRVGGEVKFSVIMARLGFAYYGNPYKDNPEKTNQMQITGGLGYRDKGFFFDLGYVYNVKKDVQFPYRLEDRANTYGTLKQTRGTLMATAGVKF